MLVTITEFAGLARDERDHLMPLGGRQLAVQEITADGPGDPYHSETRFVRVATDTTCQLDGQLIFAGVPEYFPADGGSTPTITTPGA